MSYRYSRGWRLFTLVLLRPLLFLLLRRDWHGRHRIPASGGVILVANHLSEADPLALGHYVYEAGRFPVFLAKDVLFRVPLLGRLLELIGQIPVARATGEAAAAYDGAREALAAGECLVFYPEGTCTRDPDLWPMTARTGAARLALETGAPVVPIAHWGAQDLLRYRSSRLRPLPRKTMSVLAGEPLDLTVHTGRPPDADTLRAASDDIMRAIAELLGELRGQKPPPELHVHHREVRPEP
ncbi:lysophospholipid acyltransferase family protein [Actinocorallia populi]|uniref:lysophospholipid acyltransferase family protein n=1 Tax=Actinocorallia populi TaxID=2079200 RepID=UPI000D09201C|nr:lysophospholipid acyltransferase family protein [Actinocorallia populi]